MITNLNYISVGTSVGEVLSQLQSITGRRENYYKGPEVGTALECLRNRLQCDKNLHEREQEDLKK